MMLAVAFVLVGWASPDDGPKPLGQADLDFIRAIADAADANKAKFAFGRAEFRSQDGYATTSGDARAGRLDKLAEAPSTYLFDKDHNFYQKIFPLATLAANTVWVDENRSGSRLSSFQFTTNGRAILYEHISSSRDGKSEIYGHHLDTNASHFFSSAVFPLSLGFPKDQSADMGATLRAGLEGKFQVRLEELERDASWEGLKLVRICLTYPHHRIEYWIDLKRGAIPVYERSVVANNFINQYFHDKIEFIPGHGWLPLLKTYYGNGNRTHRIVLDHLDFETPLAPADFHLVTSEPVWLIDPVTNLPFTKAHQFWDLDRLPTVVEGEPKPIPVVR